MQQSGSTPTLADVARLAGVSTATVSRCLNAPGMVVEQTRERVRAAIERLGYAPNFSARALAARRTNTVGAVIPTMENAIFARGIQAFQEELGAHGLTLLIASSSYSAATEEAQIRTLAARGADGLLLIGHQRRDEICDLLAARGIPALVAWAFQPGSRLPGIGFDNHAAMRAMARAVIGQGHRRLALISAESRVNDRARARIAGLRVEMAEQGLDPATLTLIETDTGLDDGARAFRAVWGGATRPTCVLCGTDVLAAGALIAARDLGLEVPRDVSLTGFGGIDLARVTYPALTTVHLPHRAMGREAARMLVAMIDGAADVPSVQLETELRLRGTLAPPQ